MAQNCPLCERPLPPNMGPKVDLKTCTIVANGKAARLAPMVARFLGLLSEAFPGAVTRDSLISELWGMNEPDNSVTTLNVHAHRARKVAKKLGYDLTMVYGTSYVLSPIK